MTEPAIGASFTLAGFVGRREWFGYRFSQRFADPENGKTYVVSLLWFQSDNTGRIEGPFPEGHKHDAANVPLSVVYYACGQVQVLMRAIEATGQDSTPEHSGASNQEKDK